MIFFNSLFLITSKSQKETFEETGLKPDKGAKLKIFFNSQYRVTKNRYIFRFNAMLINK